MIEYKDTKSFTREELRNLFSSVGWISADYSHRLKKALSGSATVFSAWDGEKLVGLINALDDGELTAYVHYLLVNPDYQKMKIGTALIEMICEKYKDFLYIVLTPENKKIIDFYKRFGFSECENAICAAKVNYAGKDSELTNTTE